MIHPNMTLPSTAFIGNRIAERDSEQGELLDLSEEIRRHVWRCISPLPWDDSLVWRVVSAGFKKGEVVTLRTIEVTEPE